MHIMDSKKIILKSIDEIKLMRESAQLVSKTLGLLAKEIRPGKNDQIGKQWESYGTKSEGFGFASGKNE